MSEGSGMATLHVGIDIGTQGVRVLIADVDGNVHAAAAEPLASQRAGDRHEQDPTAWWKALGAASRRAVADVDRSMIAAVAACSTSGTFVLTHQLDAVGPAVMYNDRRGAPCVERVRAAGQQLWNRLGYAMQEVWALPRLCAVLADPGLDKRWQRGEIGLMHQGDFINAQLTRQRVPTDWAQALKTGFDVSGLRWPVDVFDLLGIDAAGLPPVVPPGTIIGAIHPLAADHTGFPPGTPVVSGTTDSCAAQIAAGALAPGRWNSVLGTTLAIKGFTSNPLSIPQNGVYSHRAPDGGWLPGGASNVGAGYLEDQFGAPVGDKFDQQAMLHEPAAGITYPLTGTGERFPFDSSTMTAFSTITQPDPGQRYAAALQGVAFVERMSYELLLAHGAELSESISVTGGGVRSRYWVELRAAVLNHPVRIPVHPEPAFGMAIVAAKARRGSELASTVRDMVRHRAVIDPQPSRATAMHAQYDAFVAELIRRGHVPASFPTRSGGLA